MKNPSKSGFEDDVPISICRDRAHNPPTMLYIPPGKRYRHICPSCGTISILLSSSPSYNAIFDRNDNGSFRKFGSESQEREFNRMHTAELIIGLAAVENIF